MQSLWDWLQQGMPQSFPWLVLLPPWLSEWSSRLPGHSMCPHGLSARHSPSLPLHRGLSPWNMPRVHAKAVHGPGQAGINNTALAAILAMESHKGKVLGSSPLFAGALERNGAGSFCFGHESAKNQMLQRNSPWFLSSTRIRAATTGKGGQRVPVLWEELEVPQG